MTTMTAKATWTIELRFEEDPDRTHAMAVLRTPAGRELHGHGQARRNPVDRPQSRIGEEVAGARALSNLAHELLEYAAGEIETNVRRGDPSV
jgi:Rv2632c-like